MAKGYLIGHINIVDLAAYRRYTEINMPANAHYGGRFLVRGGTVDQVEGEMAGSRVVIIEFPSFKHAQDFYHSTEYAEALALRKKAATGTITIVSGYDGPQPGEGA